MCDVVLGKYGKPSIVSKTEKKQGSEKGGVKRVLMRVGFVLGLVSGFNEELRVCWGLYMRDFGLSVVGEKSSGLTDETEEEEREKKREDGFEFACNLWKHLHAR